MTKKYSEMDVSELLSALETAGEKPARELLDACLERREALTPALLKILEAGWWSTPKNRKWEPEDDRWLLTVHAARLLIHWREAAALPHFAKILADEDQENLHDWLDEDFPRMGPALIEHIAPLLTQDIGKFCKTTILRALRTIGQRFPESRRRVIHAIRTAMPTLEELDALDTESVDDDLIVVWSFAALESAEIRDKESIPLVRRLHEVGYIDETIYGEFTDYLDILKSPSVRSRRNSPQNLFERYGYD